MHLNIGLKVQAASWKPLILPYKKERTTLHITAMLHLNFIKPLKDFYAAVLLVFTDYKPRTHNNEELGKQVDKFHPDFVTVFPKNTTEETRLFELLRKAYIDARYDMNYKIERKNWNTSVRG
jgi:hypothetical protein